MAAKTENNEAEGKEEQGKKRKPLLLIILVVVFLLILGTLAFFFFVGGGLPFLGSDETEDQEDADLRPRFSYAMSEFQVNLHDPVTRRFLRMTIELAYDEKALNKEIEERESELRSTIIEILRSKRVEDLDEPGGMKSLEADLLQGINEILNEGEVKTIYYLEFIFQ